MNFISLTVRQGVPGGSVGKESAAKKKKRRICHNTVQYSWASQCQRPGFDPWLRKIPWKKEWLPTPIFWPGEFQRLKIVHGSKELDTTEPLSLTHCQAGSTI